MTSRSISTLLVILALFALAACAAPPVLTSTPAERGEPTATVAQPAAIEDDWLRAKAAGAIEVASPLDNAPFNMYNADRKPDGFDVALMQDLARRLGLQARFVDIPFEELLGALQLEQVDTAAAAMAVTKERLATVDFSQTYYVGVDGILAAPGSDITAVNTRADAAGRRIGVVRGTVYEWWLRENLVKTNEMSADNLSVYTHPDDAVRDLDAGHVDLVVLDREPAQTYAATGLAKLVGQSQFSQNFAFPVPRGSTLLPRLNEALAAALADGTVARLTEQYLDIATDDQLPIPTAPPTAEPTVTAVPAATPAPAATSTPMPCIPFSDYGDPLDLTIPDGTVLLPGEPFTKGWRIVNTGSCDWLPNYYFAYYQGIPPDSRMGGQDAPIRVPVPAGSSHDIYVAMTAPYGPGTYTGYWQMLDDAGVPFGKRVSVQIQVPGAPTPTPAPTPTSKPNTSVAFWADRYQLKRGESTTIHWDVQGVKEVYFSEGGQSWQGVMGKEDRPVRPDYTTNYYLRVIHTNGATEPREFRIDVEGPPANAPHISHFDTNPQEQLTQGQCVDLYWDVQGGVDGIELLRNGGQLYRGGQVNGSQHDCPGVGSYSYELRAWGPGGSDARSRSLTVIPEMLPGNPCSQNCVNLGGQVTMAQRGDGGQYGICLFEDNLQCEECAMLRGECPAGGLKVTGYSSSAAVYCIITGGHYTAVANQGAPDEAGTCALNNGEVCDVWSYYAGQCGS